MWGIVIGTAATQLIFSKITLENRGKVSLIPFALDIGGRLIRLERIHFKEIV